jgi:hypothetical protein
MDRVEIKKLSAAEKREYPLPFARGVSAKSKEVILTFVGPEHLMEVYMKPETAVEIADGLVTMAKLCDKAR